MTRIIVDKKDTLVETPFSTKMLTLARLKEVLDYDPLTGVFRWKNRADARPCWNARYAGKIVGSINKHGYVQTSIDDLPYYAHDLAWFYMLGVWPKDTIDHEDNTRSNNKWKNLREATSRQQSQNSKLSIKNTSGFKGVHWGKREKKWIAKIRINGKKTLLGSFNDNEKDKAALAYETAARLHFGEFAKPARKT